MTENQTPIPSVSESEIDFDDWLAGGQRNAKFVSLFARLDLIAQVDELEKQRVPVPEVPEGDEAMGGEPDPNAELDAKIEALEARIYASKKDFRVQAITDDENETIKDEVRKSLAKEIDDASARGRAEALQSAKRVGITDPQEINQLVRMGANELASNLIFSEAMLHRLAASTSVRTGEDWRPLTVEQLRKLRAALGQSQFDLLANASASVSEEVPEVTVPKS